MTKQFIYEFYVRYNFLDESYKPKKEKKVVKHKVLAETRDRIVLLNSNYEHIEDVLTLNNNLKDSVTCDTENSLEEVRARHFTCANCIDEVWAVMYSSSNKMQTKKFKQLEAEVNKVMNEEYGKYNLASFDITFDDIETEYIER